VAQSDHSIGQREDLADVMELFKDPAAAGRVLTACDASTLSLTARPYRALDLRGLLLDAKNCIDFIHKAQGTAVASYRWNTSFPSSIFIW
jgi:hypothetical protein